MNKKGKTDNSPKKKKDSCKVFDVFFKKASGEVYIFFYQKRAKFVIVFYQESICSLRENGRLRLALMAMISTRKTLQSATL